MITVRNQLTGRQYEELRWDVIRYMEERQGRISWTPYVDDADPPQTTIGVGFNIQGNNILKSEIYDLLGLDPEGSASDEGYVVRLDAAIEDNNLGDLDDIMEERYDAASPDQRVGVPSSFTIPHADLEAATHRIREIFDASAGDPVGSAAGTFESRLESWLGAETLVTSSERVALLSLMYNNVLPSSENLQDAVRGDERIRAWFEIRYASNPESGGVRSSGLAKRRAYEAALFGLYDNRSEDNQAQDIYDFLNSADPYNGSQRVIDRIIAYEGHTGTGGHNLNSWINDNTASDYDIADPRLVQQISFQTLFLPVANELAELYAVEGLEEGDASINAIISAISGSSIDNEVVIGLETNGTVQATNVNDASNGSDLLVSVDEGGQTLNGGAGGDVLIGASGDDSLAGGEGADVLVGKGGGDLLDGQEGNDTLLGGEGDDVLVGGEGFDYLYGGDGGDRYEFYQGHGVDFIRDSSEGNSIAIDDIVLSEFESLSAGDEIYSNGQDGLRLLKAEDGFVIAQRDATGEVGAISVEGDASNFGITLLEYDEEEHDMPPVSPDSFEVGDADLNTGEGQMAFAMASSLQDDEDWLSFDYENRGADPDQSWINSTPIFMDASLINLDHPGFPDNPQSTSWVFEGGDADDTLLSGPDHFNDRLYGMGGDDTIVVDSAGWGLGGGGEGNDYLEDRNNGYLFGDSINPQDINDDGSGEDVLVSFSSMGTRMDGGGGDDVLRAEGDGNNHLYGGSGSDTISSGDGSDEILGDGNVHVDIEGSDFQFTGRIQDVLDPNRSYDDVIDAGHGDNKVIAGAGDDTVTAGGGDDLIHGDVLTVSNYTDGWSLSEEVPLELHGDDVIYAGAGADEVVGGGGDDTIFGGDGDDVLFGDADSTLPQAEGDDFIDGGAGNDVIQAGKGDDVLLGRTGGDTLLGLEGADYLSGGAGEDVLNGGEGNDELSGGAGNDELLGYAGSDQLNGGAGDDFVQDYWNAESGDQNSLLGGAGDDVLLSGIGMDTLDGGAGSDKLFSGSGDDTLYGGSGRLDYLLGESGDDTLIGGAGTDFMFGGAGDDTYVFGSGDGQNGIMDDQGSNQIVFNGVSSESADIYTSGNGLMVRYGAGDAVSLSGSALTSSSISFDGTEYDSSGVWGLFLYQQRSVGLDLAGIIKAGGVSSSSSSMGTMTASTNTSPSTSSSSDLTAWYGGQLVAIDSATAGIDAQDPSTWLKNGATSLTGALVFYSNASGDVMAGVPVGDGTYQAPAGAITEHTLLPDGALLSREPNFASEEDLVATPGEAVELPSGVEGDTSGIDASDEVIEGTAGDDTFSGGEGMDLIRGDGGADTLDGGSGNDILFGGEGDDELLGGDDDDYLYGDAGADLLQGGDGNDFLEGGSGDDELRGGSGNDLLIGGAGNDTLKGGGGSDQYFFSLGDGQDVVDNSGDTGFSTIAFAEDISPYDVTVSRAGDDLLLTVGGGGDTLTVTGYFANEGATARAVDEVQFSGGRRVWTIDDVKAKALVGDSNDNTLQGYSDSDEQLKGMEGDDLLLGESGDDVLDGGRGNDILEGGAGNDTYRVDLNEGHDQIVELSGENNKLQFGSNVPVEDVKAIREGNDLRLSLGGGTSSVTVASYFAAAGETVSSILFEDGSSWDLAQVKQLVLTGTDADDTINGYDSDDTLTGEAGDDLLTGNGGSDTYRFSSGDGQDVIITGETDTASTEIIRFDESVSDGDVSVLRNGDDVILGYGNGDSVTVRDFFLEDATTASAVDRVEFSGGAVWTTDDLKAKVLLGDGEPNTIEAYSSDDLLEGNAGNDILIGGSGDDTYRFSEGDGADLIDDQSGSQDRIEFTDVDAADVLLRRDAEDLLITHTTSGDTIRVEEQFSTLAGEVSPSAIDSIIFADATSWSHDQIKQQALAGTDNIDEIYGHADADSVAAGAGDDIVYGRAGNDTISGGQGQDSLYGESGDDEIHGNDGVDTIFGGAGDDQLYGDEGDDVIEDYTGENVIHGGSGDDELSGRGSLYGDEGEDTLTGSGLLDGGADDDTITGEGGDTLIGGGGDDVITAYSEPSTQNNNILEGGTGDDSLFGSFGDDEYRFNLGGGHDTLTERRVGEDYSNVDPSSDTLVLGSGISQADLQFERHGNDLLIAHSNGTDSVLVTDWYRGGSDHFKLNSIQFSDGSSLALSGIEGLAITHGTSGEDTLQGYRNLNDTIRAGGGDDEVWGRNGDDTLYGESGDDYLDGEAGDDRLEGGSGADTLVGRSGSDTLIGGAGDDSYLYTPGSGSDLIINADGGYDGLFFLDGIDRERLSFERDGDDLVVKVDEDTAQSVRVQNHFLGGDHAIDYVQPDGGFLLDTDEINQIVAAEGVDYDAVIEGTANGEQLMGTSGNDLIQGLAGDDTLFGMGGDDELRGGSGNDYLSGGNGSGSGSGNDILLGGDGNDVLHGEDGDDLLTGGPGDDQYYYTAGGGVDTVDNADGGFDGVFFIDGVGRDRLSFHQEGDDLVMLMDADLGQQVRVSDHFLGGDNAISYVQPDDGGASIMAGSIPGLLEALPGAGDSGEDGGDSPADDDVINNQSTNPVADTDLLQLQGGFDESNLWFSRGGDDLVVDVIGSEEQVTIQDWYLDSGQQVDEIRTDDAVLQADMVDNLVNAMAAFGAPPAGDISLPQDVRDAVDPVIAANWQTA